MKKNNFHRAFVLTDLVFVWIAIVILGALALSSIQERRETSRIRECQNRLRNIAIAVHDFHDSAERLPPGTLGEAKVPSLSKWEKNLWMKHQMTSSLWHIMPYLGHHELKREYNVSASFLCNYTRKLSELRNHRTGKPYAWFGAGNVSKSMFLEEGAHAFLCPNDKFENDAVVNYGIMTQPVNSGMGDDFVDQMYTMTWNDMRLQSYKDKDEYKDTKISQTSYLGVAGAHSGGIHDSKNHEAYSGSMTVRSRRTLEWISEMDGTAVTLMYGESLGEIVRGKRTKMQSVLFGGLGRGMGAVPWGQKPTKTTSIFGNSENSKAYQFASKHKDVVIFALVDTSTHMFRRNIDTETWMQLCGANDGNLVDFK